MSSCPSTDERRENGASTEPGGPHEARTHCTRAPGGNRSRHALRARPRRAGGRLPAGADARCQGPGRRAAARGRAPARDPLRRDDGRRRRQVRRHAPHHDPRQRRPLQPDPHHRQRAPRPVEARLVRGRALARRGGHRLRRRDHLHLQAPQGPEVVGRRALHRRRHHVLVRGRLPQSRSLAEQAPDLHRQGRAGGGDQARRGHRRVQVRLALRPLPAAARLRPGPPAGDLPEALPQPVPRQVQPRRPAGADRRERRRRRLGGALQLQGLADLPAALLAEPRPADAEPVDPDRALRRRRAGGGDAQSLLLEGRPGREPAPLHRRRHLGQARRPAGDGAADDQRRARFRLPPHQQLDLQVGAVRRPGAGQLPLRRREGPARQRRDAAPEPQLPRRR